MLRRSIPVLHPDRSRYVGLEGIVDIAPRFFLEGSAGGVEIPVAVEKIGAVLLRSAGRGAVEIVARVRSRMIDAASRHDQIADRRLLLGRRQASDVVEAKLLECFIQ